MTKTQIKAELRRSALEDIWPWGQVAPKVWLFVQDWFVDSDPFEVAPHARCFFLLVAAAL